MPAEPFKYSYIYTRAESLKFNLAHEFIYASDAGKLFGIRAHLLELEKVQTEIAKIKVISDYDVIYAQRTIDRAFIVSAGPTTITAKGGLSNLLRHLYELLAEG